MPNITALQKALAKQRLETAKLEKEIRAEEGAQFARLPGEVGLKSVDSLIKALADYASPRLKGALKEVFGGATSPAKGQKRRKRATIDDAMRGKIIAALKAGDKTGREIAEQFGISQPTVNNIKAKAKLTKKR